MKINTEKTKKITYKQAGVDYAKIDPLKVMAQKAAKKTAGNLAGTGFKEVTASRGESAYVMDMGNFYLASIVEGLGTKALIADEMEKLTGKNYYQFIAQDTLAMAINDIITVGAKPIIVQAYWAIGSDKWLKKKRVKALVKGWKKVCDDCGVSWGGGETPVLGGVIEPGVIDLAAGCVGVIKPKSRLVLGNKLEASDVIVMFKSSGIHANGLTLARKIVDKLSQGYTTKMSNGQLYGEALLEPTIIYSALIEAIFSAGVKINYMVNITGHGWRKIMRHRKNFTYRITKIPPVPKVLKFMVDKAQMEMGEAYGTLNMGAGYAIYVSQKSVKKVMEIAKDKRIQAYVVGRVEAGPKQVLIEPVGVKYKEKSLQLRG